MGFRALLLGATPSAVLARVIVKYLPREERGSPNTASVQGSCPAGCSGTTDIVYILGPSGTVHRATDLGRGPPDHRCVMTVCPLASKLRVIVRPAAITILFVGPARL